MAEDDPFSKLFSFREWQRFIECRRNVLMRKHFPTKFRNDPDELENPELYVRFIKSALSRREEKPEIRSYKNVLPRNLTNAMEKCINMLGESMVHSEHVVFSPSFTPNYSYLEQLLEHPMYDLPEILRTNFNNAEVNYLTKPKKLVKSATKYGMKLGIVNSRLHFLDELAPQFETLTMPSLKEWNKPVTVLAETKNEDESSPIYSAKNDAQRFELYKLRQFYYDAIQENLRAKTLEEEEQEETSFDYGFEEVTFEGKLPAPSPHNSGSNAESVVEPNNETEVLNIHKKYNLEIPHCLISNESESLELLRIPNERKKFTRTSNGKFVLKKNTEVSRDSGGKFASKILPVDREEPEVWKTPRTVISRPRNSGVRSLLSENKAVPKLRKKSLSNSSSFSDNLFVPSADYWMYHCVFSKVKPKHFEFFESELPVSFQWLLNECSDLVEMSTEDLYEQVCLIETHFAHVLRPDNPNCSSYDSKDNKIKIKICKKKW